MGKCGLLLTEQTLVGTDSKCDMLSTPLALSTVPMDDGAMDDNQTKNALVEHFKIFHQRVLPSSKTGSSDITNPKGLLEHYMSTERRALLLCMLVLGTGQKSFETFKAEFMNASKGDAVPNAVLAIGMTTDVLAHAVNPKEVGPAVRCMLNMFRHAGDKQCENILTKCKLLLLQQPVPFQLQKKSSMLV